MGQEMIYGVGALILLTALIYGVLQYRYRNRAAVKCGDKIVEERYRRDET